MNVRVNRARCRELVESGAGQRTYVRGHRR